MLSKIAEHKKTISSTYLHSSHTWRHLEPEDFYKKSQNTKKTFPGVARWEETYHLFEIFVDFIYILKICFNV